MTSKISSVKMFKEAVKRNGAMAALLMLVYFVAYPLAVMIETKNWEQWYEQLEQAWKIGNMRMHLAYNEGFLVFTIASAVVLGILQFVYLHNREKLDFYHSFPVRREKLFMVQYVSGVVIWAVPYVVNLLLALFLASVKGYTDGVTVMLVLKSMVVHGCSFLLIYSFMILAMMMTGKIFTAILGMGVFMACIPGMTVLIVSMCAEYFVSYMDPGIDMEQVCLFSPIYACVKAMILFQEPKANSKYLLLAILILALLVAGISMLLYRRRSTESAGKSMAFSKAARVIKFVLVLAASMASQLLFYEIGQSMGWGIFGMLFGFLLASALVEFIYRLDIREIFVDKRQMLFTLAVTICVCLFFWFDIGGYDRRLPNRSDVKSVSINSMNQPLYGPYAGEVAQYQLTTQDGKIVYLADSYYSKETVPITDVDKVYQLLEQRASRQEVLDDKDYNLNCIYFCFTMKDGSELWREYRFGQETRKAFIDGIWEDEEYREQSMPVFNIDTDNVLDVKVENTAYNDMVSVEEEIALTQEEKEELYEVLKEEIMSLSASEMDDRYAEKVFAYINVIYAVDDGNIYGEKFRITESHTKTAALLKKYGYEGTAVE